ncbi:lysine-specific demethylase 9-like [Mercenaria mercenaria]|uniref:lysine-specific demethylase 9-like n=1 Tax=Mercenaria mercenaria TaxID=6596 RepID=UPI00234F7AAE|nr:lysine-specific demethylase 9-like [Mercenaria mercenaria]
MVVISSNVMYQCQAFYIGNGLPDPDKKGVEAIQSPLRERYRGNVSDMEGSPVKITIMPDVVDVQFTDGSAPEITLPISTLSMCAAVRCVESFTDTSNMKFIPVHSVISANEPDSEHPAIFSTSMRTRTGEPLLCYAFVCESARDALHLVNATQTAHTALRRGYSPTGALKFFNEQSSEFDRTIHVSGINSGGVSARSNSSRYVSQISTGRKSESRSINLQQEEDVFPFNPDDYNTESTTYVTSVNNASTKRVGSVSRVYNDANIVTNGTDTTYYVKAGDVTIPPPTPVQAQKTDTVFVRTNTLRAPPSPVHRNAETILVKSNVEHIKAPTPVPRQTIIVDKPIINPAPVAKIPPPKVIERPVYIDPPPPPKVQQQVIYVDKPVFKEMKWPAPPKPEVVERPVVIDPPPPPRQEPQKIVVDKPVLKEWPRQPTPPPPIIEENLVYIEPPKWPERAPQRIIVDKPIVKEPGPPPPAPAPIIEERAVYIDPPEFPEQQPHRIIVEKPCFNPPKPAPPPPAPIIEEKKVYIDPPAYPRQEPQRIVVEKPIIQDPGPPPLPPEPIIIEKPVHIEPPKYQQQEPQRIIVEKPIMRDPGPPPPPPKPIIIEKIVYIDPPPWPKVEPQRIVVEKPVFRPRPPPPTPKPIIIEKPVYIDQPVAPLPEPQKVVVEKPVLRTAYSMTEARRVPATYGYQQVQYRQPANVRSSYVVRSEPQRVEGLRRYAWSDAGEGRSRSRMEYNSDGGGYRIFGQPRDFRSKQFMNERSFGRRVSADLRHTVDRNSYRVNRMDDRRSSVSS